MRLHNIKRYNYPYSLPAFRDPPPTLAKGLNTKVKALILRCCNILQHWRNKIPVNYVKAIIFCPDNRVPRRSFADLWEILILLGV